MHRALLRSLSLTALLLAAGCADPIPTGAQKEAEEWNAREAVFRYQFHHNASSQRGTAKVLCLRVALAQPTGGFVAVDPDDDFLKRFGANSPLVRKHSACEVGAGGVFDKATKVQGLALNTGAISWASGEELTVAGGYYEASLSASGNTYRLKKQGRSWVVVEDRLNVIS